MYDYEILKKNGVDIEKSLELFGDMDTYNSTLINFYQELDEKLENLKEYKESGDMSKYSILVHSLKSDAKYFGFNWFAEICLEHELKSKSNDIYYVSTNFDNLMQNGIKVATIIKEYLKKDSELNIVKNYEKHIEKKGKILVVDDSSVISNFINSVFYSSYDVIEAKDGIEAINKLSDPNLDIDCMLLDINLPNVNGYEVLKFMKINGISQKVKTAIITGNDSKTVVENIKDYDALEIVEKPFNEIGIKNVVEKLTKKDA